MDPSKETIIDKISNKVITQDILDIDYHDYVDHKDETKSTHELLQERFFSYKVRDGLSKTLGPSIIKLIITLPDTKRILTPEEQKAIPESNGSIDNHLSDLLLFPKNFSLIEKPMYEFEETLNLLEKSIQRSKKRLYNLYIESSLVINSQECLELVNEAANFHIFFCSLMEILDVMRIARVKPKLLPHYHDPNAAIKWLEGDINSNIIADDPDLKPDFIISGQIKDIYIQVPIEIKRNLRGLVSHLEHSTKISERTEENPYTIIQQCLQLAIKYQCPAIVVTDYFITVYLEIDFEKTLDAKNTRVNGELREILFKYRVIKNTDAKLTLNSVFLLVFLLKS